MNNAQVNGFRMMANDATMGLQYEATRLTISRTSEGWEARKGGKLLGVTQTREGAKELLGAL